MSLKTLPFLGRNGDEEDLALYAEAKEMAIEALKEMQITQEVLGAFITRLNQYVSAEENMEFMKIIHLGQLKDILKDFPQVRKAFNSSVIRSLTGSTGDIVIDHIGAFLGNVACKERDRAFLMNYSSSVSDINRDEYAHFVEQEIVSKIDPRLFPSESSKTLYTVLAERVTFFHLDPLRTNRVRIDDILSAKHVQNLSYALGESRYLKITQSENPAHSSNWVSLKTHWRMVNAYRKCDQLGTGMLNLMDLHSMRNEIHAPLFINRIFDIVHTYGREEIDYSMFIDINLAIETRAFSYAAQRFIFKCIDTKGDGFWDRDEITAMATSMLLRCSRLFDNTQPVDVAYVVDEIFDITKPKDPCRITLADISACGMAGTVLGILIDCQAFMDYEERELKMQDAEAEDELEEDRGDEEES